MIVTIFGGRDEARYNLVLDAVRLSRFGITMVASGACGIDRDDPRRDDLEAQGADGLGERWAKENGVPVRRFYAAWKRLGKPAGPIRNGEMADFAEAGIQLPGGKGTANMAKCMRERGKPVFAFGEISTMAKAYGFKPLSPARQDEMLRDALGIFD